MLKKIATLATAALVFTLAGCDDGQDTPQAQEQKAKNNSINELIASQPAPNMRYSPTRNTIAAWAKAWDKPGKLAYTYITEGPNDPKGGYYVFVGPPVSYCVALTAPYKFIGTERDGSNVLDQKVEAPGIDGAYGGGDCSVFYGIDAVSNSIVTFNLGMNQNMFYGDQPNPRRQGATPLGDATVESAKQ